LPSEAFGPITVTLPVSCASNRQSIGDEIESARKGDERENRTTESRHALLFQIEG
jgi:hypothetical protein